VTFTQQLPRGVTPAMAVDRFERVAMARGLAAVRSNGSLNTLAEKHWAAIELWSRVGDALSSVSAPPTFGQQQPAPVVEAVVLLGSAKAAESIKKAAISALTAEAVASIRCSTRRCWCGCAS
jgi:hypothetical protein